jgi:glycosyltransferase involved in cell wall biosynthesis
MRARVSFVIPCYNEEQFLPYCLASIGKQTAGNFEVVVVDNNCTDGTRDIAASFGAKVVPCPEQGISAARNAGARFASGSLLAFLDADSTVGCDWLLSARSRLARRRLDAVYGRNVFSARTPLHGAAYNVFNLLFSATAVTVNLFGRCMLAGNNLLIKKSTLDAAGGWPPFIAEDIHLAKSLRRHGAKVGFVGTMRARYSPRRFEKAGYFRTLHCWFRSSLHLTPETNYRMDYAARLAPSRP